MPGKKATPRVTNRQKAAQERNALIDRQMARIRALSRQVDEAQAREVEVLHLVRKAHGALSRGGVFTRRAEALRHLEAAQEKMLTMPPSSTDSNATFSGSATGAGQPTITLSA